MVSIWFSTFFFLGFFLWVSKVFLWFSTVCPTVCFQGFFLWFSKVFLGFALRFSMVVLVLSRFFLHVFSKANYFHGFSMASILQFFLILCFRFSMFFLWV